MATNRQRIQRRRLFLRRLGKPVQEDDGRGYRWPLHRHPAQLTDREWADRTRAWYTHRGRRITARSIRFCPF